MAHGHDSNANLGSSNRSIPLNLYGVFPAEAWLGDESQAQASAYTRIEAEVQRPWPGEWPLLGTGEWHWLGGASARRYHQLDRLQRWEAHLGTQWRSRRQQARADLLAQYRHVDGIGPLWQWDLNYLKALDPDWLIEIGGQWQTESGYRPSPRLHLALWHQWQGGLVWGRVSRRHRPDRAGGDTWRFQLGGQSPSWQWRRLEVNAYAQLERRQDTQAYNPPLFGDVQRRDTSLTLGGRARLPLTENLDLAIDSRWERTRANLALFERQRWMLEAQLRWQW